MKTREESCFVWVGVGKSCDMIVFLVDGCTVNACQGNAEGPNSKEMLCCQDLVKHHPLCSLWWVRFEY